MPYLDKPFNVSTGSSRRPTPTTFEHLKSFAELVQQYLRITNQSELTNVNELLNQTGNLYVSNEIARVIAQLIGATPTGWETIKATPDGALYVYPAEGLDDIEVTAVLAAGTALIGKIQLEGSSQTPLSAKIDIATTDTHSIIAAVADKYHYITSICFTVSGEVNVTLRDVTNVLSGPMDFGAENEPRGICQTHEQIPLKCHINEAFQITLSADIQVSGYVTYYTA